jgi:aquaporin Z
MSMNPARTLGSALFEGRYTALWLYFAAPLVGMLLAAEVYVRRRGIARVYCAKLNHLGDGPCPFRCRHQALLADGVAGAD